ncbi:MAG: sulfate reduction electron transfer complex DsrMKJOP subunit DsrJ [Desulfurivibrio sp.]|nr:sulfate reduction electron transfer complex DsrMKJOP subunit DsrJ [Desulfurivibrio sp.]
MYGSQRIIPALIVFVGLMTFAIWYNIGQTQQPPDPELPTEYDECVRDTQFMRESHMVLLHQWRDDILRKSGPRTGVTANGLRYDRSLQKGCLDCHDDKEKFCDECHNYASVAPDCWRCHFEPTKEAL